MKNILLIILGTLLIFSCKNSNKAIECKNEVKINKVKYRYSKPYHYDKISAKRIEKIKKKAKSSNNIFENEPEVEIVASTIESVDVNQNSLKQRIKRARAEEGEETEDEAPPPRKLHILSLIGFVALIASLFASAFPILALVGVIGLIINIVSLFLLRNNKELFYGKGFSTVPLIIATVFGFVFGTILIIIGLITFANWGFVAVFIGAGLLIPAILLGLLLYYYYSD